MLIIHINYKIKSCKLKRTKLQSEWNPGRRWKLGSTWGVFQYSGIGRKVWTLGLNNQEGKKEIHTFTMESLGRTDCQVERRGGTQPDACFREQHTCLNIEWVVQWLLSHLLTLSFLKLIFAMSTSGHLRFALEFLLGNSVFSAFCCFHGYEIFIVPGFK